MRELRNDGETAQALDDRSTFLVMHDGVPVGVLPAAPSRIVGARGDRMRPPFASVTHTLLAVPVPELEDLVRRLTARWEPGYDLGTGDDVHAHITVLGPFVPLADLDDALDARLLSHFSRVPAFTYRLVGVGVFPGNVVYLSPDPDSAFVALTRRTVATFPGYPPYGGKYDSVVPHMTVGPIRSAEMAAALVDAAESVVPVDAVATEVRLFFNGATSFRTVRRYPLGA